MDRLFQGVRANGAAQGVQHGLASLAGALLEGFDTKSLTADETTSLNRALSAFESKPFEPIDLVQFYVSLAKRHIGASQKAEMRKEVEAEVRKEFETKQKVKDATATSQARRTQPQASNLGAAQAGQRGWASRQEMRSAHANGDLSNAEMREAIATGAFERLPETVEG